MHFGEAKRAGHPQARPPPCVASPARSPFAFEEREYFYITSLLQRQFDFPFASVGEATGHAQ